MRVIKTIDEQNCHSGKEAIMKTLQGTENGEETEVSQITCETEKELDTLCCFCYNTIY